MPHSPNQMRLPHLSGLYASAMAPVYASAMAPVYASAIVSVYASAMAHVYASAMARVSGRGAQSESWMLVCNQGHMGVGYDVKNEGLEKEKHVRMASRMLGAKLIELCFRWIDRGVFLAVFFQVVKWRIQHDNIWILTARIKFWKREIRSYVRTTSWTRDYLCTRMDERPFMLPTFRWKQNFTAYVCWSS